MLAALVPQVDSVVVVDDGSGPDELAWLRAEWRAGRIELLELGENCGIAAAHNRGIEHARRLAATHVLLMDQDSEPAPGMVAILLAECDKLERTGMRVGAIGPRYRDPRQDKAAPFIQLRLGRNAHVYPVAGDTRPVPVGFLIASGSLIPISTLDAIGGMEERLFIDYVDLEWCFRASAAGYGLYGAPAAELHHRQGDAVVRLRWLRGRTVVCHSPLRLYYTMRNRLALYVRRYAPKRWIAKDACQLLLKVAVFSLFVPPRRKNAVMMLRGLWHALRGRFGKIDKQERALPCDTTDGAATSCGPSKFAAAIREPRREAC
jgi:rhamnosyltransferase